MGSILPQGGTTTKKRKLKPILDGEWKLIGPSPDLKGIVPGAEKWKGNGHEHNAPVDHHIFPDPAGRWHLWGCVRSTTVGRIFYHWRSDDFQASPWESTGEIIRIEREYGESYGSSPGEGARNGQDEAWIQSPYFVRVDDTFYMFYGGGAAMPTDEKAHTVEKLSRTYQSCAQMCLMTSTDGIEWDRYRNKDGHSRLFIGPGPTRDPCLIDIDGLWHMYYAGTRNGDIDQPVFWCWTSGDLVHWSEPILVHVDSNDGALRWDTECPFVIEKEGYYYLFRTEDYYQARTHVYRSEEPLDFGIGDASSKYVGMFAASAPELYTLEDGSE